MSSKSILRSSFHIILVLVSPSVWFISKILFLCKLHLLRIHQASWTFLPLIIFCSLNFILWDFAQSLCDFAYLFQCFLSIVFAIVKSNVRKYTIKVIEFFYFLFKLFKNIIISKVLSINQFVHEFFMFFN